MKKRKTRSLAWLLSIGVIGVGYGSAEELMQSVAVDGIVDVPIGVPAVRPIEAKGKTVSRLQDLERKAAERDLYLARTRELQKKIDLLTGRNDHAMMGDSTTADPAFGQLSMLKEKATVAEQMARQAASVRLDNSRLVKQRDELNQEVGVLKKELLDARSSADEFEKKNEALTKKNEGLQETVRRLLLGEFEYYEVKSGETLQSIAANPLVYGDASRAGWLRQANEGRVRSLTRLFEGDMLVIPRFPRTGAYEF